MSKDKAEKKKHSKMFKLLVGLLIALGVFELAAFGALAYYLSDYSHADATAEKALKSTDAVTVVDTDDWIEFTPAAAAGDSDAADVSDSDATDAGDSGMTGIVFYPGGKVEDAAYAPLMMDFAEKGYFCAVVHMPFNLAILDSNAAKDVKDAHPEITNWLIGGHSLGGLMAAKYAAISDFDGLFLLASYSNTDLSDKQIAVVSVYGDKDGVLNMNDYNSAKSNLPPDTIEYVIKGGNHAQFGSYGAQDGDGKATISADDQRAETVKAVLENIAGAQ